MTSGGCIRRRQAWAFVSSEGDPTVQTVRKLVAGLGVAIVAALPHLADASNDSARNHPTGRGVVITHSAGTFSWLARPAVAPAALTPTKARLQRQIGRGSWICSPAGFGRGSRCYSN